MSAPLQMVPGMGAQAPQVPPMQHEDPLAGVQAMLLAIRVSAQKAASANSAAEAADFGKAALAFAQAIVVLDPSLTSSGTPAAEEMQHQAALAQMGHDAAFQQEQLRQQTALEQEKVRAAAMRASAKPEPAKRVSVTRDGHGRMTGAEMSLVQ